MLMVAIVVWIVLMILWLFFGGFVSYEADAFNARRFGGYTLIPWACVLILGLIVFGAFNQSSSTVVNTPPPERR